MRHQAWARRLRPIPFLAAMGAALSGCVCCGPRHYGDTERAIRWPSRNEIGPYEYDRALARSGRSR